MCGPMLKRKSQNPHATLLTLFLNATQEFSSPIGYLSSFKSEVDRLIKYLPASPAMFQNRDQYIADVPRFNDAPFNVPH